MMTLAGGSCVGSWPKGCLAVTAAAGMSVGSFTGSAAAWKCKQTSTYNFCLAKVSTCVARTV